MWTTDRVDRTGRAAAGRACSFNLEEQRSSLAGPTDLHYGKNFYFLSRVERTCPPGGCPARVARRGWACGGHERGADRGTRRDLRKTDESAFMIGPAGFSHGGN